jgi:diaminopropionate ammonia-lyase
MNFLLNSLPGFGQPLTEVERGFFGKDAPQQVQPFLALWGRRDETNLISLPEISSELGLERVVIKDEGARLGQGSFKSLGGGYALMVLFKRLLERHLGRQVPVSQLLSPTARDLARSITVCCATDGNHGRSVSSAARLLGCRSVVFIHSGVSQSRADAIGADEVVRVEGNYDLSVSEAERMSTERGWLLLSDTSWPGYEDIPALVGQGYTILADEALRQSDERGYGSPTHVFLQAGVGGFAGSVASYLIEKLARNRPKIIVVEPDRAACVFESARAGEIVSIMPTKPTIMAMLECYRPSLVAWQVLAKISDGFVTVSEDNAKDAMRRLATRDRDRIVAGESGAAGLAGLLVAAADHDIRTALGLGAKSRVLLVNTETATDPESYKNIVGRPPEAVVAVRTVEHREMGAGST